VAMLDGVLQLPGHSAAIVQRPASGDVTAGADAAGVR
jgi:hypothetical protein